MVTVLIVTYNGIQWIEKCLNSCKGYPIIVVDNNSSDNTIDFISKKYPEVKLIKQSKNLGFGAANNIGISYALNEDTDYVFLLNQDAYLEENSIEKLLEVHKRNNDFGILSPIHLNGNGTKLDRNFSYYISYNNNPYLLSDSVIGNGRKDIYEVPFVNAAAWLLPKSTLLTIGGFDPLFFQYGEDDHYCHRLHFHGLKVGVVSEAFVLHDREDRKTNKIEKFSEKYFINIDRVNKIKYSNINLKNAEYLMRIELKRLKVAQLKSIFSFRLNSLKNYRRSYMILLKSYNDIINSREKIKVKGPHFLNITF